MKLSVSSWSFPHLTLAEATEVVRALGIEAIDLGYFFKPSLDKNRVLADPEAYGTEVSASLPVQPVNLFHLFGEDLEDRNLARVRDPQHLADMRSVLKFARAASIPSVFVLPGMINPGQSRSQAIDASAEALKPLVEAGQRNETAVLIEPHLGSILNSPDITQELVHRVPGLNIVLDLSHFIAMGFCQTDIEPLASITGHVHVRQARPGLIQTKMEEGIIDFPGLFGTLRDSGYDGWVTIEYEHEAGTNSQFDDVLSETVKMRDCFRAWTG